MKNQQRQTKAIVRRRFLGRMPKGGLVVEIGVWKGEFSRALLNILKPEKLILIDPWAHVAEDSHAEAFAARTGAEKMDRIHKAVCDRYKDEIESGKVEIARDFSVPVIGAMEDESISFAYVDGDHSYDGVKSDLAALFPKMRFGGVIGFDDYHRRGWWGDDVLAAVNEFVGANPKAVRIRAVEGAQIAIEKIPPLAEAAEARHEAMAPAAEALDG
ncbi:MAG: class I SAM-dependent methyltransferase [Pseudomonadota bacterium]